MKFKTKLLLLLLLFVSCHVFAQSGVSHKKFKLLTYGLPDFARQNASNIIQNKWGIQFYGVAGCVVTEDLEDSVKKENNTVRKLIEAKYGTNWGDKFYEEIEEEYNTEIQIDSLVRTQPYISNRIIHRLPPDAPFPMYPIDKLGNYIVTVSTYNNNWEQRKLYKLKVNYKNSVVKILQDYTLKK
jgi:hypothetical protein